MAWDYIAARHFRQGRLRQPRVIVIHTTESPTVSGGARSIARYFARTDRPASAHFVVDPWDVVQCVDVADTAFAAPGANTDGIQIEICGFARTTSQEWLSEPSNRALAVAAAVAAELVVEAQRRGIEIPVRKLSADDLRNPQAAGICGHADVSQAFRRSTHWDPGTGFPWSEFLARVRWWVPNIRTIDFRWGGGAPAAPASPQPATGGQSRVFTERDQLIHDAVARTEAMVAAIAQRLGVPLATEPNSHPTDPLQQTLEAVARIESDIAAIRQHLGA